MEVSMPDRVALSLANGHEDPGCAYPLGVGKPARSCGLPRRPKSSYCQDHHVLCHVACGTSAEADFLREVETLACAVGGRQGWRGSGPPRFFLKRLEYVVRGFF
jgi:hypothetical protein